MPLLLRIHFKVGDFQGMLTGLECIESEALIPKTHG